MIAVIFEVWPKPDLRQTYLDIAASLRPQLEKIDGLELHRLDCSSSHGHLDNYEFAKTKFEQSAPEELRPLRLVTGDDLIAAGYAPGPDFSRMLEVAEDAQLEARIQSKEEGLELVRSTFGPPERVS